MTTVARTGRLELRQFTSDDAPFILELLNDDAWLRFIGDRGVRTLADAVAYLRAGPCASYTANGFGLYMAARHDGTRVGMCGLVRRDTLDHPDLGYAFLPAHRAQGYATEAGVAVLAHAWHDIGLARVQAITDPANTRSINVLERLGFTWERDAALTDGAAPVRIYGRGRDDVGSGVRPPAG
ncbi:MAG: GNAT family N-acetyltransferase [Gemmatimonadaceae bacterium]|nr:GNAT family N-acetyltransferase [Gemmatimonadaceae bacterium]